jgi:hypothetical protein
LSTGKDPFPFSKLVFCMFCTHNKLFFWLFTLPNNYIIKKITRQMNRFCHPLSFCKYFLAHKLFSEWRRTLRYFYSFHCPIRFTEWS